MADDPQLMKTFESLRAHAVQELHALLVTEPTAREALRRYTSAVAGTRAAAHKPSGRRVIPVELSRWMPQQLHDLAEACVPRDENSLLGLLFRSPELWRREADIACTTLPRLAASLIRTALIDALEEAWHTTALEGPDA